MSLRDESDDDEKLLVLFRKMENLSIPECCTSLHVLDADTLVMIVIRALECILRTENEFPAVLPPNIAQRHRICTDIASKVKEIGFKGECGYNQLLYPVESQTRSILTWLAQRLPREDDIRTQEKLSPTALLNVIVAEKLRDSKEKPWHHPSCFYGVPPRIFYDMSPLRTLDLDINLHRLGILDIYKNCAQVGISAASTILEDHTIELIRELGSISQLESNFDTTSTAHDSHSLKVGLDLTCSEKRGKSTKIQGYELSKLSEMRGSQRCAGGDWDWSASTRFEKSVSPDSAITFEDHTAHYIRKLEEETLKIKEIEVLQKIVQSFMINFQLIEKNYMESKFELNQIENNLIELSRQSDHLEGEVMIKRKTLELMPFAVENIELLSHKCAKATEKLVEMNLKWDIYKEPLEKELMERMTEKEKRYQKCHDQLGEIKILKDKMLMMASEMKEKEITALDLSKEVEGLTDNFTRASYTHRILDIVTSLDKQTNDTKKIISEIRSIQKLSKVAQGAVDRADAVAEELIFASASADTGDKDKINTYRRLKKLRNLFTQSINIVMKVGQLDALSRELVAAIEEKQNRISLINFNQISLDLIEIKKENNDLILEINSVNKS